MSTPGSFADTVKQQADIVRIIGDYLKLKKSGAQNFTGLCPFHNEKTPSFSVHATRQFYHCFGCGVSGDVFSFVQKVENITFPEAVRAVAQKMGIPVPRQEFSGPGEAQEAKLRTALLDLHQRACAFFEAQLRTPEGAAAREYLAGRGLSQETIATFRIGYAPDSGFPLRDHLKGASDEELLKASGLFSWKEVEASAKDSPKANSQRSAALYSKFRNRIMFPIANETGKVIAFTGRALGTDDKAGPKYLNSPETAIYSKSRVLYNLDRAREAIRKLDYALLVEGQMDCIAVFAAGFHNVIASSGTAFTEAQVRLLARFSKKIVVNFDPDAAGAAAADRSLALLVGEDFEIKVLTLDAGLDPDLFLRKRGREAYADSLKNSQKYFDYLIDRARATFPARTPEGKVKAVNFLLPHIHRVPSRIARDELAKEMAQRLGIDSAVLMQELRHAAGTRSTTVKPPAEAQVTDAERILIRALAASGQLSVESGGNPASEPAEQLDPQRQARYALTAERLHHGLAAESLLESLLASDEDAADAMALPLSEADRGLLASTLLREDEPLTADLLEEALQALRRRHLERQRLHLRTQIAEAERQNDAQALTRLMQEKVKLDRALALP
ncbi:MAG TPA: DNA primase [Terriglobales bacterium]|nr:DNA primase [Terriglobales bacterium]